MKRLKYLLLFALALSGVVFLTSSTNAVQFFGKAIFPIMENIDNARNGTELNAHLRGDSTSGYEIWARNNKGTEFPIFSGNGAYLQKELYTDNQNLSMGDTVLGATNVTILKKITPTNPIRFNRVSFCANLNSVGTTLVILYITNDTLGITLADTIYNSGASVGYFVYDFPLSDTITWNANETHYIGFYSPNTAILVGNKYNSTSTVAPHDSTWVYNTTGVTPPEVGDAFDIDGLRINTFNMKYYFR